MADITQSDVVVTIVKAQLVRGAPGLQHRNFCKVTFGDGSLTYGAGVPYPTAAKCGFSREIKFLAPVDLSGAGTIAWKNDHVNSKFRAFSEATTGAALAEFTTGATPTTTSIYVEAVGW